ESKQTDSTRKFSVEKIVLIAAAGLVVAAVLAVVFYFVGIPALQYSKALALEKKGEPAAAYEQLEALGDSESARKKKAELLDKMLAFKQSEVEFAGTTWLALAERDGKTLLVTKDIIRDTNFNSELADTSWEESDLRAYLNGAFYNNLPEADRIKIAETDLLNTANISSGVSSGKGTTDHIFLLSVADALYYFPTDSQRQARLDGTAHPWWLRTSGTEKITACIVKADGAIGYAGSAVNMTTRGLRPACWANLAQ
ncbi:MAG: DUF6273 domain-containing protein, partial [Oscillospiraceae bacterium]|nr:DUF6273 domain-containing protein [Oscillospiraceae bacterium]